jgi:hypothetical protein
MEEKIWFRKLIPRFNVISIETKCQIENVVFKCYYITYSRVASLVYIVKILAVVTA